MTSLTPLNHLMPLRKYFTCIIFAMSLWMTLLSTTGFSQTNAIVSENQLPGNPKSEWDISGAGDLSIQGFATDMSVNKGSTINFKINAPVGVLCTIKIYRLGWYGGNGARFITSLPDFTPNTAQPGCLTTATTGLIDCGNWSTTSSWDVPGTAVTGIYIAKLTRSDNNGSSHMIFIVRDDAANSDIVFKTSDATWQAYNPYGGNSLYIGNTSYPNGHATEVSYNRPFTTRNGGGGGGAGQDWVFNAEYPMLRWIERNGFNVSYVTDVDMSRNLTPITPSKYKVMLSVGHDEYWSAEERASFETARSNGVHLAFFSGNEVYWKSRWDNSIDASNTPYRTLICYKEGTIGENSCGGKCDPAGTTIWTGLWRDGGAFPYADGNKPENALTGQISWAENSVPLAVPSTFKNNRFWRGTSVASLASGATATMTDGTVGYEWDQESTTYQSSYPKGRILLSTTTISGSVHHTSLYRFNNANRALVFGAGSVQWSWGLDNVHDNGSDPASQDMQQATLNLFADMGIQPTSLQGGLSLATASTDVTAPVVVISSPANNATVNANLTTTISGTCSDAQMVAGVEISFDGGVTWQVANGTNSWSYSWTPTANGSYSIKVRGFDDSGNMPASGNETGITINVTGAVSYNCPCTVFTTDPPVSDRANQNDGSGITLGMKFRSTINGYITGVRFWKAAANNSSHLGALYTANGILLAQATYTNETDSGWQQVNFGTPVAITANTTYVAVYYSDNGDYVANNYGQGSTGFLNTAISNPPLNGLKNSASDPNGLYDYVSMPAFPTSSYNGSNYYIDAVFVTSIIPDVTAPIVSSVSPASGNTSAAVTGTITVTFSEEMDSVSLKSESFFLSNGSNTVPATIAYLYGSSKAVLTPQSYLSYNTTYTVTVKGGSGYFRVKDVAGNAMANDYTWSFTTTSPPPALSAEGQGGPILVISSSTNMFSRYPVEILKAEGWNAYKSLDITNVDASVLSDYDVVILGEMKLTTPQANMLTSWATAGGTLITFRPDSKLTSFLGLNESQGTMSDKYMLVNTATGPGVGIVSQTIQFHGKADLYTAKAGTTVIATLYSSASSPTSNPAVTSVNVGSNGGQAIAFTFDLAKSIIYTRQGNPANAGQKRDGTTGPIRSDDIFYSNWLDLNRVAIPQADEMQRLLNNIIVMGNLDKKPMPRFWFLPKGLKAAVVMTGDDHAFGKTKDRFDQYYTTSAGNTATDVANWDAIRASSYIYTYTPMTNAQVADYQNKGFDIGLHVNTGCANFTSSSWSSSWTTQLNQLKSNFPSIVNPTTNRTHCIAWSDWATQPKLEAQNGVRLDVNYYYWPEAWVSNRPGMFTGSGTPMRFADLDGSLIDCYQVATQLTDESGMNYALHISSLLDSAQGESGYYGVFCANMHTDIYPHEGSDAILLAAKNRNVPVISAKQLLDWMDGRSNSSFGTMTWNSNQLSFNVTKDSKANNLKAYLPTVVPSGTLVSVTRNGTPLQLTKQVVKGIEYAFFDANSGNFVASYNAVTPVNLLYLKATAVNITDIRLNWATASESNNKGFVVERSKDVKKWDSTGFVIGVGNSTSVRPYEFMDKGLEEGQYFYRLKQVDLDGKSTFTNVVSATLSRTKNYVLGQNFPNPTVGTTMISYKVPATTPVKITLYDLYGRTVKVLENNIRQAGNYTIRVDVNGLLRGAYYYKMDANGYTESKKMIIN